MSILTDLFSSGAVLSTVGTLVLGALGWLLVLGIKKFGENTLLGTALEAIRVEMNNVYNSIILPKLEAARAAGSDEGEKISAAERKDLLLAVWANLMVKLEGPAKDFIVKKGFEWVSAKVEDILLGIKAKSGASVAGVQVVVPPPAAPVA